MDACLLRAWNPLCSGEGGGRKEGGGGGGGGEGRGGGRGSERDITRPTSHVGLEPRRPDTKHSKEVMLVT